MSSMDEDELPLSKLSKATLRTQQPSSAPAQPQADHHAGPQQQGQAANEVPVHVQQTHALPPLQQDQHTNPQQATASQPIVVQPVRATRRGARARAHSHDPEETNPLQLPQAGSTPPESNHQAAEASAQQQGNNKRRREGKHAGATPPDEEQSSDEGQDGGVKEEDEGEEDAGGRSKRARVAKGQAPAATQAGGGRGNRGAATTEGGAEPSKRAASQRLRGGKATEAPQAQAPSSSTQGQPTEERPPSRLTAHKDLSAEDTMQLLPTLLGEYEATRAKIASLGAELQILVNNASQMPVAQAAQKRDFVKNIQNIGKLKKEDDDALNKLRSSSMEVWRRWKQDNRAETAAGSEAKPAQKGAANAGKAAAAGKAGAGARVVKAEDTQAQPLTADGSVRMPNGSAAPADVVLLTGFSGTGDSTRDSAVSLLAACLEEPVSAKTAVEVALEAEEQLYDRYAEAASTSGEHTAAPLPHRAVGAAYKQHLHALWRLLSDATPALANGVGHDEEGARQAGSSGDKKEGGKGSSSGMGEALRRALLGGVFSARQFLESAFAS